MRQHTFLVALCVLLVSLALTGVTLALVGDLDISGTVDGADLSIVTNAYGSQAPPAPSANWDWRADINRDQYVNLADLTVAGRNYGDTFNFHWPRRFSNLSFAGGPDAAVDSRGHVHVIWSRGVSSPLSLYYTQLDASGNTVVDDVLLSNDAHEPRLALDAQDNVHIVWERTFSSPGAWYTRLDAQGRTVIAPRRFCSPYLGSSSCAGLAVAADGYGHPHLLWNSANGQLMYAILDSSGNELLSGARLNTAFTTASSGNATMTVDRLGHRHVLWLENTPGPGADLIYTRLISGGLPSPNQIAVAHIAWASGRRLVIQTDSQGSAHVLWHDSKGNGHAIYWRRINPDGTMTAERLVTTGTDYSEDLPVNFAIDGSDQIHLMAMDDDGRLRYARLDRDGNVLVSFREVAYPYPPGDTLSRLLAITIGSDGVASLFYTNLSGPQGPNPLFVMSTLPDAAANDVTRADLVLDNTHVTVLPSVARITQDATITATVANGGWVTATNVVVTFTETVSNMAIASAAIGSLPPFGSATVVRTFNLPDLEYTSLLPIRISAGTATVETTLTNNAVTITLGVVLPAHAVDVQVTAMDETYSPDDRSLAWGLYGGQLTLNAPVVGYHAEITQGAMYNGFLGVPLDASQGSAMTTTMVVVTLTAPGYSTASQVITAARLIADPYRVIITPTAPVPLYVNRWGEVHGTIYTGTAGFNPLQAVTVTLDAVRTTVSDESGVFTFTKVVSGVHTLEALHAGNLPTTATVSVQTGVMAVSAVWMPPTTKGVVRGTVVNDLGQPYNNALVQLYGSGNGTPLAFMTTGTDGTYRLEVANAGAYTGYQIRASHAAADPYTSGLVLCYRRHSLFARLLAAMDPDHAQRGGAWRHRLVGSTRNLECTGDRRHSHGQHHQWAW